MSDPLVSERRIRPIQDAVASGNWKQALKECDKWQKKGEKSDKFLALKALVLVHQTDRAQSSRGQQETLQLCHRNPAITDIDAIHLLQSALKDLSLQDTETPKLWDRAVAAKPSDTDLLMIWLNNSIAESNWLSAQKAAMALRKAFPTARQYEFWNILMYYLVHKDASVSEKERGMYGMLAYRLLSKAAEALPPDSEQLLSPGKAIATPEELALLVHIYLDTGHASEAVDLLRAPALNEESRVGQQDPQLVNTLLLQALEKSERWTDAFQTCKEMVEKPEFRADDRVWNVLHKAGSEPQVKDNFTSLLNEHISKEELRNRPALLTRLKGLRTTAEGNSVPYPDILDACTEYYRLHKDKSFCFDDLKPSLLVLNDTHRSDFSTMFSSETTSNSTILNRLFKLKYDRLIASPNKTESTTLSRATSAIEIYRSSLSSTPCPEALLIASLDLLSVSTLNPTHLLRAVLLLSLSHSRHEDYHPTSILLIGLYRHLGLLSLAMAEFVKLSIKNLQYENVAHIILERISTLHPFPHGDGESAFEPLAALDAGLSVLERSEKALNTGIREGLRNGAYVNVIDSVRLKGELQRSINRPIYGVEERRVARLTGEGMKEDVVLRLKETVDKRDYSFLPVYTDRDEQSYEALKTGPRVGEASVDTMSLVQYLITYVSNDALSGKDEVSEGYEKLLQLIDAAGSPDRIQKALTVSEFRLYKTSMLVSGGINKVREGKAEEVQQSLQTITENLQVLVEEDGERLKVEKGEEKSEEDLEAVQGRVRVVEGVKVPGWRYLHTSFIHYEIVGLVSAFVGWLDRRSKKSGKGKAKKAGAAGDGKLQEQLTSLHKTLASLQQTTKDNATTVKKGLSEGGVLGQLVDVALARDEDEEWSGWREAMEKVYRDEGEVEMIVGGWIESWEDALEGIVGVKVKGGK